MDSSAQYIWFNEKDTTRKAWAKFRKTIDIKGDVSEANIHIYADTVYQLFINGSFIEFGPVRNDPKFPQFDTHDISAHLSEGTNVIAVYVQFFGCKCYRAMPEQAGFIASGNIEHGGDGIDLSTGIEDSWRCKQAMEHNNYTKNHVVEQFPLPVIGKPMMKTTSPPSPRPTNAAVTASISRMPGPPAGPS